MNIAIIIALSAESHYIEQNLGKEIKNEVFGAFTVTTYQYHNHTIYLSHCGVGTIKSSVLTTTLLNRYKIDLILNLGTAGCLNTAFTQGDVFIGNQIYFYEFGAATENDLLNIETFEDEENNNLYHIDNIYQNWFLQYCKPVKIACGNKFICNDIQCENLFKKYHCDICEMESVGIYLAAQSFQTPCVFIKTTSDFANSSANEDFNAFIEKKVPYYITLLFDFLNSF